MGVTSGRNIFVCSRILFQNKSYQNHTNLAISIRSSLQPSIPPPGQTEFRYLAHDLKTFRLTRRNFPEYLETPGRNPMLKIHTI